MTERIDHAAGARRHVEWAHDTQESEGQTERTVTDTALIAQVHATLALAEQQRLANVIQLATFMAGNPDATVTPIERAAWLAIAEDGTGEVRPEIREALGL